MGVISAAVPVKKTSSAMYRLSRGMSCSMTSWPNSPASVMTQSRVSPGSTEAVSGGVMSLPSRTVKRFSPLPSDT